jgi:hypothetical protein
MNQRQTVVYRLMRQGFCLPNGKVRMKKIKSNYESRNDKNDKNNQSCFFMTSIK